MKLSSAPRQGEPRPVALARSRARRGLRAVLSRMADIGRRIDEDRAVRDRTNQSSGTVDGAFWIYLR